MMPFMFYMYVLKMDNGQIYIGFTNNIKERLKRHHKGEVKTTSKYLPVKLIYCECYLSERDAVQREKMIKRFGSTYVHLKQRIFHSIKDSQERG